MTRRKAVRLSISTVVFLLTAGIIAASVNHVLALRQENAPQAIPTTVQLPESAEPSTMSEALGIAAARAHDWLGDSAIVSLQSVDHPEDDDSAGLDGRRRSWQAVAQSTDDPAPTQLWIDIVDGVVVQAVEQPSPGSPGRPLGQPILDSPEALKRALEARPDLIAATEGKARGFHFGLENSPDSFAVISVRGEVRDWPAVVRIDAASGELESAQRLGPDHSGGILYSADAGRTWKASTLVGVPVTDVASDPLLADRAFAVAPQGQRITLYQSYDGGRTWASLGGLPDEAGDWPFSMRAVPTSPSDVTIVIGTWSGLWASSDQGNSWFAISGLPEGPKQWLGLVRTNDAFRLFVSITAGDAPGLYASSDLCYWSKVADGIYRLSESFNKGAVLAVDDLRPGEALILNLSGEKRILTPGVVLRSAGDFEGRAPLVLQAPPYGVGRLTDPTDDWQLRIAVASLAASPEYLARPVVVAGGFRSGIYRSDDGGRSWDLVLRYPSNLVEGSGEIGEVEFISPNHVIAINGGALTWLDF